MRDYFEEEMSLLREGLRGFARAFPRQADRLNLQAQDDRDPYVERLLEGVAYLTGQVRRHIDHDIPDFAECLLQQLCPHLLRSFPSVTIMAFSPVKGQLQKTWQLAKGTEVWSGPVGDGQKKTACRFRTTSDIVIHPIHISDIRIEENQHGGTMVRLFLRADSGIDMSRLNLAGLKFFLNTDMATAEAIHYSFTHDIREVCIRFPEHPIVCSNKNLRISPCHMTCEDALLPIAGGGFFGFQLLQEYLACKEKFLFVQLDGMEDVHWPEHCHECEIVIATRSSFSADLYIKHDTLKLHCIPAINLFETSSEPVELTHKRVEYPVIVDTHHPEGIVLYDIQEAVGVSNTTDKRTIYYPLHSFRHREFDGCYYQSKQGMDNQKHTTPYISIGGTSCIRDEMLSLKVTASNGFYPRRFLKTHSMMQCGSDVPAFLRCVNLTRPSSSLWPPDRGDFLYHLLSHLSFNFRSAVDADLLKRILKDIEWSGSRENARRIQGIRDCGMQVEQRIKFGVVYNSIVLTMTLDEDCYRSIADMHLFGMVLHRFFCMAAPINHHVELRVQCHPSNRELIWDIL